MNRVGRVRDVRVCAGGQIPLELDERVDNHLAFITLHLSKKPEPSRELHRASVLELLSKAIQLTRMELTEGPQLLNRAPDPSHRVH